MNMKNRFGKVAAGLAVAGLPAVSGAVPAQALTHSGRQDCSAGGGYVGVRGEQQRYGDWLSLDVGGRTETKANYYHRTWQPGLRYQQNWSATSVSRLMSGSYGYCYYPY
ncbi:hypothetical protein [Micrococcus luteus]|uniref:hypothetical protein n=1 Tax=Micrococcus luteus TaxID=1270 RepID=UPI00200396E1|nr:hypothetical protein [Micrococcus luteus]MCK6057294.1 hypothetical protein [Micrococcus luteus]MCK6062212.1 hypothetical protein [Micrococcus luteus]MCK6064425.1 hypothetical protein [Micrococcus luteus]MCK6192083.1 hypothetical protein [Micrococcus luteus]MCK6194163.1 hypothetical protein [Micrococcus luteus]